MDNDRQQDPADEVEDLEISETEISDNDSNAADPGGDVIIIK